MTVNFTAWAGKPTHQLGLNRQAHKLSHRHLKVAGVIACISSSGNSCTKKQELWSPNISLQNASIVDFLLFSKVLCAPLIDDSYRS